MELFLIITGILVVLIVVPFIIFDDLYLIVVFKLRPKTLRNYCFRKLKKENQETYILGTLHGLHLKFPYYTLTHIKAVIENLKPYLVLLESKQSEIERGNLADGPPEMLYSHLNAQKNNIPVKGIDWWLTEEGRPGTTNKKRDDIMVENIIRESKGYQKVLVIIGATHMIIDSKKLKKLGYKKVKFSKAEKDVLYYHKNSNSIYPKGSTNFIEKRIEVSKQDLLDEKMTEQWKDATNRGIKELENFKEIIEEEN